MSFHLLDVVIAGKAYLELISQLLSEEEKAILAAEEAAAGDKKDCSIM